MTRRRRMTAAAWWAIAVIGMSATLAVLLLVSRPTGSELVLGLAGIGLLVLGWFVFGHPRVPSETPSTALIVVVAAAAAVGVAGNPNFAIMQAVLYPMAWVFARSTAQAIGQNVTIAAGVTVGFLVSLGISPDQLPSTALTMVLSLGFSIAMGLWISRMTALGEERGRLLAELQGAQEQIAALHRDAGAAAERERLARELHDTIAQDLTGLVMLTQRARREAVAPDATLAMIEEGARAALGETRALVAAGAALDTDGLGIDDALRRLAERFERETGVQVTVTIAGDTALSRDAEVVILRCAQEALANARKHARATLIRIEVDRPDPDRVRVTVTDDGIGFDPATAPDGFGIRGMSDRLALVAGTLRVTSAPGAGSVVVAELPVSIPSSTSALGTAAT